MIKSIKPRPTVADVAREAGVSVATVDRVINRRARVKAETARSIHDAAIKVGFHAIGLLARRLENSRPARRLGFLLLRRTERFYRSFASELARATRAQDDGKHEALVEHLEDLTPASVADRISRWRDRCDALALVAADHPKINAAIEALNATGIPVFAMLSDVLTPARAAFFGIDNRRAGRTAGWAVARLARSPGEIAIVLGNHRYLNQELSESSFRLYIREHASQSSLLEPLSNFENAQFAYEAVLELLQRHPDIVGLYVAGGGAEGVIQALREQNSAERIAVVCNELVTETRAALTDGIVDLVIATPIAILADRVAPAMLARLDGHGDGEERVVLPFDLYVSENI
jgi:LacI family transcriptional regulator